MQQKKVVKGLLLWVVVPAALFFGSYTMLGPLFVETAPPEMTEKLANAVGAPDTKDETPTAAPEPTLSNEKFRPPKNFSVKVSEASSRESRSSWRDDSATMDDVDTSSILDEATSEPRPRRRRNSEPPTREPESQKAPEPNKDNSEASGADEAGAGGATDPANGDPNSPPGQ